MKSQASPVAIVVVIVVLVVAIGYYGFKMFAAPSYPREKPSASLPSTYAGPAQHTDAHN